MVSTWLHFDSLLTFDTYPAMLGYFKVGLQR